MRMYFSVGNPAFHLDARHKLFTISVAPRTVVQIFLPMIGPFTDNVRRLAVYIWRYQKQSNIFVRACHITQRVLLTNFMLFRNSGSVILRRTNERFWAIRSASRRSESRLLRSQHILLSGCLLSFAQDKITDDEMLRSMKNFSSTCSDTPSSPATDNTNGDLNHQTNSCKPPSKQEPDGPHVTVTLNDSTYPTDPPFEELNRFVNPPLTLFVRRLRQQLVSQFSPTSESSPVISGDNNVDANSQEQPPEDNDHIGKEIKSILHEIHCQPDGTGFVDESWELVIDKTDLRLWRRPLLLKQPSDKSTMNEGTKYEYRICGTLNDVSALSFLEVQLNLAYRRHWDDRIVSLDCLPSSSANGKNGDIQPTGGDSACCPVYTACDTIRWVARFPFPLANREYVYARRWWLESNRQPTSFSAEGPPRSLGQHAVVLSRSVYAPGQQQAVVVANSSGGPAANSWTDRMRPFVVAVKAYRSDMLIESHSRFDELGMNYYLIYYDDPCLALLGESNLNFISTAAISHFMNQLHSAALHLDRTGRLPDSIPEVVHQPRTGQTIATGVGECISPSPLEQQHQPALPDSPAEDSETAGRGEGGGSDSSSGSGASGTASPKSVDGQGRQSRQAKRRRFFTDYQSEEGQLSTAVC